MTKIDEIDMEGPWHRSNDKEENSEDKPTIEETAEEIPVDAEDQLVVEKEGEEERGPFDIGDDMETHLQELLRAAEEREDPDAGECPEVVETANEEQRVPRSRGIAMHWNPTMGDKSVILHGKK